MEEGERVARRSEGGGWRICHAPPFLREVAVPRNRPCESQINQEVPFDKKPVAPVPMTPGNGHTRLGQPFLELDDRGELK
jgi:hypothetical protein